MGELTQTGKSGKNLHNQGTFEKLKMKRNWLSIPE